MPLQDLPLCPFWGPFWFSPSLQSSISFKEEAIPSTVNASVNRLSNTSLKDGTLFSDTLEPLLSQNTSCLSTKTTLARTGFLRGLECPCGTRVVWQGTVSSKEASVLGLLLELVFFPLCQSKIQIGRMLLCVGFWDIIPYRLSQCSLA